MNKNQYQKSNFSLSKCTTFQQTGSIPLFTRFDELSDLKAFIQTGASYFIVGKGSNSIINPNSTIEHIIQLSPTMFESEHKEGKVTFSAGTAVNDCMKYCVKYGVSGLEFSAGVPATIGGMVTMNFGCWGVEVSDVLDSVQILNENATILTLTKQDCHFAYRTSIFNQKKWIILNDI